MARLFSIYFEYLGLPYSAMVSVRSTPFFNEYVLTGLRTQLGINLDTIESRWGAPHRRHVEKLAQPFIRDGKIIVQNAALTLSREGKLLADYITAELFWEE